MVGAGGRNGGYMLIERTPARRCHQPTPILEQGRVFNDGCIALHSDDPPLPHRHGGVRIGIDKCG
jgi:hypothetical protein